MLGLPQTTEVRKALPKAGICKQFGWNSSQRECFDADVSRLDFVNWISPRTLPAIAEGKEVKEIFVVEVTLKRRDIDIKNIELLGKCIPQKIVYLMRFEDETMLGVYHSKLFLTSWQRTEGTSLRIDGLDFDRVFLNFMSQISGYRIETPDSIPEIIELENQIAKIRREAEALQKKVRNEKQFNRQIELNSKARSLKRSISEIETKLSNLKKL